MLSFTSQSYHLLANGYSNRASFRPYTHSKRKRFLIILRRATFGFIVLFNKLVVGGKIMGTISKQFICSHQPCGVVILYPLVCNKIFGCLLCLEQFGFKYCPYRIESTGIGHRHAIKQ